MKHCLALIVLTIIMSACSNNSNEKSTQVHDLPVTRTENIEEHEPIIDDDIPESVETESMTKSNIDWDKAIDEYEEYIDEYLKFIKKSRSGDMTALAKSLELMKKAESASKRLEEAKDSEMTKSQIKRMMKIQTKMIDAI